MPLRERFAALRAEHPLPPVTGERADKAFFDGIFRRTLMLFADASALVAIIAYEPGAAELADKIEAERIRLCSALSVWEMVAGLGGSTMFSVPAARTHVRRFLSTGDFQFVGIGEREFDIAADAYAHYGKGRHPATLNMGDCYAYACARANRAGLLFTGHDFARTDIEAA